MEKISFERLLRSSVDASECLYFVTFDLNMTIIIILTEDEKEKIKGVASKFLNSVRFVGIENEKVN